MGQETAETIRNAMVFDHFRVLYVPGRFVRRKNDVWLDKQQMSVCVRKVSWLCHNGLVKSFICLTGLSPGQFITFGLLIACNRHAPNRSVSSRGKGRQAEGQGVQPET